MVGAAPQTLSAYHLNQGPEHPAAAVAVLCHQPCSAPQTNLMYCLPAATLACLPVDCLHAQMQSLCQHAPRHCHLHCGCWQHPASSCQRASTPPYGYATCFTTPRHTPAVAAATTPLGSVALCWLAGVTAGVHLNLCLLSHRQRNGCNPGVPRCPTC